MPKKNGFTMYVDSRRGALLAAGHSASGGYRDLVDLCADDWTRLAEDEKREFTEKAKWFNERAKEAVVQPPQQQRNTKFTGKAVVDLKSPKKATTDDPTRLTNKDHGMLAASREILTKLFAMSNEEWMEHPIVICSFTMYAQPGYDYVYLPAEIGLTAMSLKHGVFDNFGRVIDPGQVPKGYGIEAVKTARELGLPNLGTVPDFANYECLVMSVTDFLRKYKGTLPGKDLYVFAFDSDFLMVRRCLEWLYEQTGNRLPVKVLSIDQYGYLASLRGKGTSVEDASSFRKTPADNKESSGDSRVPSKSLIGSFIYSSAHPLCAHGIFVNESDVSACIKDVDNYKYFEELCCIYHAKSGKRIHNCALNSSNRYAYSILEILTLSNAVRIIKGGHYPEVDAPQKEKTRRLNWLRLWGITKYELEMKEYVEGEDEEQQVQVQPRGAVPKIFRGKKTSGSEGFRSNPNRRGAQ